ncbi:hypothetical protein [Pseudomonas sp. Marseille-QA0892]
MLQQRAAQQEAAEPAEQVADQPHCFYLAGRESSIEDLEATRALAYVRA